LEEGSVVHVCGPMAEEVEAAVTELSGLGSVSGSICDVSNETSVAELVQGRASTSARAQLSS
jgi:hypothetical protein